MRGPHTALAGWSTMTWLASPNGTKRPSFSKRPWVTPTCSQATFDGGPDDPRTIVAEYQQLLRADLFDELAYEVVEDSRPPRWVASFGVCKNVLATCQDGLRWLWLADSRSMSATTRIATASAALSPQQELRLSGTASHTPGEVHAAHASVERTMPGMTASAATAEASYPELGFDQLVDDAAASRPARSLRLAA